MRTHTGEKQFQCTQGANPVKLPALVDDVHYKLEGDVVEGKFTAQCLKCPQKVKAHVKSNSNLLAHMQKKHSEDYDTYKTLRASEKSKSRVCHICSHICSHTSVPSVQMCHIK